MSKMDRFFERGLAVLFLTVTFSSHLSASGPAQLQACGVFGALESAVSPVCPGKLIGGFRTDGNRCPQAFDALQDLEFDDDLHQRWYTRFWTGRCKGFRLLEFCVEDDGGWHDLVDVMSQRVVSHERSRARAELWALGRMIGFEWAKRNHLRKISTDDLRDWYPKFRAESDTWRAIRQLCSSAERNLSS